MDRLYILRDEIFYWGFCCGPKDRRWSLIDVQPLAYREGSTKIERSTEKNDQHTEKDKKMEKDRQKEIWADRERSMEREEREWSRERERLKYGDKSKQRENKINM